jgi:hypothetical protein
LRSKVVEGASAATFAPLHEVDLFAACPLHRPSLAALASGGPPPPLRGGGCKKISFSRCAFFAPRVLQPLPRKLCLLLKEGGERQKAQRVETAFPQQAKPPRLRSSRRALPFEERARLPALYRGSCQSLVGPWLSPVPRFMAAPTGLLHVRCPGSQLLMWWTAPAPGNACR